MFFADADKTRAYAATHSLFKGYKARRIYAAGGQFLFKYFKHNGRTARYYKICLYVFGVVEIGIDRVALFAVTAVVGDDGKLFGFFKLVGKADGIFISETDI